MLIILLYVIFVNTLKISDKNDNSRLQMLTSTYCRL